MSEDGATSARRARCILFDAEGVVIDTESLWDREQEAFLRAHGVAYERSHLKPLLTGRSLAESTAILRDAFNLPGSLGELVTQRTRAMHQLLADVQFVPGFRLFYERAKARYSTAVATAMDPELFFVVDERLGLSALFDGHVYTLLDARCGKAAPDLFLVAAAALQVEPSAAVVLEDAPHGIVAARRAGMTCIAMTTTYPAALLQGADLVVDDYEQLAALVLDDN